MDNIDSFFKDNRDHLIYEGPNLGHRFRFFLKLKKRDIIKYRYDIPQIARGAAAAIFLFSITVPTLLSVDAPDPQIDTVNAVASDMAFFNTTSRRSKLNLSPSQLQQACFNLKQLGFETICDGGSSSSSLL